MRAMARHARSAVFSDVVRHRAVVAFCVAVTVGALTGAWAQRDDRQEALLWFGFAVFVLSVTVPVASMSIGPRPLRSFGVGAWFLVAASGALLGWLNRGAIEPTSARGEMIAPVMLLLVVMLVPTSLWMMIERPEQNWEREVRLEREGHSQTPGV